MTYNFPIYRKGDTFKGVSFTVTVNGVASDLTNATIKMMLKTSTNSSTPSVTLSTANGKIVITSAFEGKFKVIPHIVAISDGFYYYDIQITYQDGTVKTYIDGSWKVLPDITV